MSKNRNLPHVLELSEVLGEHLFAKICEFCPNLDHHEIGKITGILLDCPKKEIFEMLEHMDTLKIRINAAILSMKNVKCESLNGNASKIDPSTSPKLSRDSIAEELFDRVTKVEPELSSQITGMLLELDDTALEDIISSPTKLADAIHRAKSACVTDTAGTKENDIDDIGDIIFDVAHEIYPENAAKISGMLLEMSKETLQKLLENRSALKCKIEEAAKVLQDNIV